MCLSLVNSNAELLSSLECRFWLDMQKIFDWQYWFMKLVQDSIFLWVYDVADKSAITIASLLNRPCRSVNTIELIEVSCSLSIYPAPLINDATCQFAIKPRALVIQFARRGQSGKIVSRGAWGRFVNMVGKTRACKLKLANLSVYHWHVSVPFCQRLKE